MNHSNDTFDLSGPSMDVARRAALSSSRRSFLKRSTLTVGALAGSTMLAHASTLSGAGEKFQSTTAKLSCGHAGHKSQVDTLRATMNSPYIERKLKVAMLHSSKCPTCQKPLGRHALSALKTA